ncbi:hypothetical protein CI102_15187, partial [Trichoderma harzianum]
THSTTNLPVRGLSMGEQTGPRVLLYLWSYVLRNCINLPYLGVRLSGVKSLVRRNRLHGVFS